MVSIIKSEFSKMKRYSVIWIGVATMFTVVLLARFMATALDVPRVLQQTHGKPSLS